MKKHNLKDYWNYLLHRVLNVNIGKMHYIRMDIDIDKVRKHLENFDLPVKELTFSDFLLGDKHVFDENKLAFNKARLDNPNNHAYGII